MYYVLSEEEYSKQAEAQQKSKPHDSGPSDGGD